MRWAHVLSALGVVLAAHTCGQIVGCNEAAHPDPLDAQTKKCAGEARAEYYVGEASVDEAMRVYDECMRDGGF